MVTERGKTIEMLTKLDTDGTGDTRGFDLAVSSVRGAIHSG